MVKESKISGSNLRKIQANYAVILNQDGIYDLCTKYEDDAYLLLQPYRQKPLQVRMTRTFANKVMCKSILNRSHLNNVCVIKYLQDKVVE